MPSLVVRQNLSVPDVQTYFTSLWSGGQASFSSSQARGWLTDLEMVGREGAKVMVHKAVMAPLCPYLARLCQDNEGVEDQKIIFSDVPVEIIRSVVELLYTGKCTLTPVANVKEILDFTGSLGLHIQADRLQVDFAGSEIVVGTDHAVPKDEQVESEFERKERLLDDTIEHVVEMARKFAVEPVEKDANSNYVKRVVKNKSTEPRFSCEYCKFECRFWIQLVEHSNNDHTGELFHCKKCNYKTSKLKHVKSHDKQVHVGKGGFSCTVCGFKAPNPKKLEWHHKFHHKIKKSVKVKSKSGQSVPKEVPRRSLRGNIPSPVDMLHCSACPFKSFSKKSLRKHFKRFHEKKP